MIKLSLCIIVILSSTLVGFSYSSMLTKRKSVLEAFILELKKCSTQIRYSSKSLSSVFEDNFMNYSFCDNKPFESQWKDMLEKYHKILNSDDLNVLQEFSKTLGTSDVSGELTNIDMYIEMLKLRVKDAELNISLKGKLYKTLGLSFGLSIAILLI